MEVERSWETLVEEIGDDQVSNELALTMAKVCNINGKKLQNTFEVIVKLAQEKMYPDLMMFMLENENPNSKIDEKIIKIPSCPFMRNVKPNPTFTTMMENVQPIHLAALFGKIS